MRPSLASNLSLAIATVPGAADGEVKWERHRKVQGDVKDHPDTKENPER
jgi:hypothetical protein